VGGHATAVATIWTKNSDIGPHTRPKLYTRIFFEDTQKLHFLKIELAAVVDWGRAICKDHI